MTTHWKILRPLTREEQRSGTRRKVLARCKCGHEHQVLLYDIQRGHSRMCRSCSAIEKKTRHGATYTREYAIWSGIVKRCRHGTSRRPEYRDVPLAPEWEGDGGFERFLAHVGAAPSSKHTIDRIDNSRGYVPGNVRWATMREQNQNRSDNVVVEYGGLSLCITEWARQLGLPVTTLHNRLFRLGWSAEAALTTPRRGRRSKHP